MKKAKVDKGEVIVDRTEDEVKLDTATWEVRENPTPEPIESESLESYLDTKTGLDNTWYLHILLPFGANQMYSFPEDQLTDFEEQILHYYSGVKLALSELDSSKISINVHTYDTKGGDLRDILDKIGEAEASMILGGRGLKEVEMISNFAREKKIYYGSPWLTKTTEVLNHPYYIQLNPGLESYIKFVMDHALSEYEPEQIMVVGSSKELDRINRFEEYWKIASPSPVTFQSLVIEDLTDLEELELETVKYPYGDRVFILASTSNYHFTHDFLRSINILQMRDSAVVYGFTTWDHEILSEYKKVFELRLANPDWPIASDELLNFQERFFKAYQTLPLNKALEGYNHCKTMWNLYSRHGKALRKMNPSIPTIEGINTKFRFKRSNMDEGPYDETGNKYLQNTFLYMLSFKDYLYTLQE